MSVISDLQSGGRRKKIHDAQIVVKLPQTVKDLVEAEASRLNVSAGAIHRDALAEYLTRRGISE